MDELIKQALEKYFSDFKEYNLLILIGFTIVIAIIQIIQSMWVSKKIEKFKNELKKSEIKYSKYNQLQIEALSEAYELLTDFLSQTFTIKNKINSSSPEIITSISKRWLNSYGNVYTIFSKKKYILPHSIKKEFSLIVKDLHDMRKYIESEKNLSAMHHTWQNGEVEFMGDNQDLKQLKDELNKYDKRGIINKTIENIKSIKNEIENYFDKIE
ncbi:hypothetical protein LA303_07795 [Candidatus Sulfidibacterium hydrothermale]|uniref:hypothetical protein n=1 Tax=Candidatus Sulfidibacterium hydrothermale TaxID=2875962 RepID=UPI001F0A3FD6|nr:hypothetical protein [Candidatus Sulfidibacterium hydrothermale]UBM61325.1 hypothetical protein LA303_07795 [Candidatus Sulfidibacterium hydrothermale]